MIIKIFISIFVLFAASRAYLRYRGRSINLIAFLVWLVLWTGIAFFVWWPNWSIYLANIVGIGRGVDVLVYVSVVVLFYGLFRVYIKQEFIERELTSLVRNLALQERDNINNKHNS